MRVKQTLSLLLVSLALAGCKDNRREYDEKDSEQDAVLTADLTLIGKTIIPETYAYGGRAYLYFSMNGDTNKTDVVAVKRISACLTSKARVFDAKICDKKKIFEWRKQLSHRNEDYCDKDNTVSNNRLAHRFDWELVKE